MRAEVAGVAAGAYARAKEQTGPLGAAIPLLGVKVVAEIMGFFTRVVMRQRFRNAGTTTIEAVYVFPAPEKAAVTGLVIETGGRRIVGKVKEKEAAFDEYDDALSRGYGAALLDQHRPNVFQASVGNLEPGQEMVVELTWVMELTWEGESLRFTLPTTIAPRYAPEADRKGVGQTEADKVNPPTALEVPYGLEFTAEVDIPGGIAGIESPSHPLRWRPRGDGATVELSHETAAMNEDLVLLIAPRAPRQPHVIAERQADGSLVAAVSFLPKLEAGPRAPREVIFIIDRSGSMAGNSIGEAKRALQLCLRGLREGDRFDVIGFGSHFVPMFGESRPYDQENLDAATKWVEAIEADMGGTEVLGPMREALGRAAAGMRREVILITDGEVSNEAAVIELARSHAATTRVFAFGIGHGPSEHFIGGVARASGGAAEFVKPGERIEPKVLRQFARLGTPAIESLKVEWNGKEVAARAPWRLGHVFDGEPFLLYLRLAEPDAGIVRLAGKLGERDVSWELPVDAAAASSGALIGALAARAEIRDLEEGTSRLHAEGGSQQRRRRDSRVGKAIRELGERYQLASSQTSFVAVEVREGGEDQERGQLVLVPQALTRDWGAAQIRGMNLLMNESVRYCCLADEPPTEFVSASGIATPAHARRRGPSASRQIADFELPEGLFALEAPLAEHNRVSLLQHADGSWNLDDRLASAIGTTSRKLRSVAGTLTGVNRVTAVVATAAALVYLRLHAADSIDEWRLLAQKAEEFIDRTLAGTTHTRAEVEKLVAAVL